MAWGERVYETATRAVGAVGAPLARGSSKLARGLRGRSGAGERIREWARNHRHPSRPLVWVHAPSVGAGFQARAVMEELRALRDGLQVVHTYFSPSAESFPGRFPASFSGYLPWDVTEEVGPVLDALRPSLLVFTKTEVWPVLSREAERRGVTMALIAASLPKGAGRLRWPGRRFLRPAFSRLDVAAAVADADARRLPRLGVPGERASITGDPGVDSALRRSRSAAGGETLLRSLQENARPTLVAGSTWRRDEAVLLPACTALRDAGVDLRLVVAPHEPSPARARALTERLRARRWTVRAVSECETGEWRREVDALVVDRLGLLARLYSAGRVAFVGGGFHGRGLHSVLEPAAASLPAVFGPRHGGARAAADLLERGGAKVARSPGELARVVGGWLRDEDSRRLAARAAFDYIRSHRGAAKRTASLLLDHFETAPPANEDFVTTDAPGEEGGKPPAPETATT